MSLRFFNFFLRNQNDVLTRNDGLS